MHGYGVIVSLMTWTTGVDDDVFHGLWIHVFRYVHDIVLVHVNDRVNVTNLPWNIAIVDDVFRLVYNWRATHVRCTSPTTLIHPHYMRTGVAG